MEMRNSREENNSRRFTREEWLTSTQIKSFFSRLAAARRKAGNVQALESAPEEIDENLINEIAAGAEEENRRKVLDEIAKSLQVQHPIIYDMYDLCELNKHSKLQIFNVNMMKTICSYFEIPFKSRDRKAELLKKIQLMISECDCNS
jgi:Arf-GAP/Rho-GAP domain/ANK repeat/PH domain-containing protein 3